MSAAAMASLQRELNAGEEEEQYATPPRVPPPGEIIEDSSETSDGAEPADLVSGQSAGSAPSLVSLDSSTISPGAGTRGGVAYSSSSPAYSSRCSDAMAAADIVWKCGLSRAEDEGWMLHSENGSPNPLCYHQNLVLFDLTMASSDVSVPSLAATTLIVREDTSLTGRSTSLLSTRVSPPKPRPR